MAMPLARQGSWMVLLTKWLSWAMSTLRSLTYGLAQTASASSPVVRKDELNTRELRVPLLKLMPSAYVLRIRMPLNSSPSAGPHRSGMLS